MVHPAHACHRVIETHRDAGAQQSVQAKRMAAGLHFANVDPLRGLMVEMQRRPMMRNEEPGARDSRVVPWRSMRVRGHALLRRR